jgi:hypothetical protein
MPKKGAGMQSWQFFHYVRKHLGRSVLYAIFSKRHARTVDLWCQDPRFTDKEALAYDPLQGLRDLLSILDDHGHVPMVRSALQLLASGTSVDCDYHGDHTDPLPTITEEILADYRAVAALQSAIEAGLSAHAVNQLLAAAKNELDRTVAKYLQEREK